MKLSIGDFAVVNIQVYRRAGSGEEDNPERFWPGPMMRIKSTLSRL
jgi:hypothetical protein